MDYEVVLKTLDNLINVDKDVRLNIEMKDLPILLVRVRNSITIKNL